MAKQPIKQESKQAFRHTIVFVRLCRPHDGYGCVDQDDFIDYDQVNLSEDDDNLDKGEKGGEDEIRDGDIHKLLDLSRECGYKA